MQSKQVRFVLGGNYYPGSQVTRGRKSLVRPMAVRLPSVDRFALLRVGYVCVPPGAEPSSWSVKP